MVDRKGVLTNLKNFYEWNFKNYPLNFDEAQVIIKALEAWDKVIEELGDINMDIYTNEVKEIIKMYLGEVENENQ